MQRCAIVFVWLILSAGFVRGQESDTVLTLPADGFPRVPPTEPSDALKTFRVLDGFRLDLLAAEPLVADPVDLAYDENGRAFVVEMRDYPFPEKPEDPPAEPIGRVRVLEDTDGDSVFDRSHVFVDRLSWPTSVALWKGGVFVAAAPDLWYFKDTDGDHRADVRRKVLTGFSRYNVQAIMNNLKWGLDHRIYGAASGNGGEIVPADNPQAKPVLVKRRDFRFDPVAETFEAISGGARFGHSFDDWGNRFLCNIRNPVQHVVLPNRYLARNPQLAVVTAIHDAADSGETIPVYRISPPEPWREFRARRWVREQVNYPRSELVGAGFFTSSSGVTIYRGAAYPEAYRGNAFVADVASNVVHREVLTPDGVTFKSRRVDENAEFVSSADNWFRPVNFVNAPDGTLHILDMYRETIEHPWSIPDDIRAQLDLASGNDRGRIYRLAPPGFQAPPPPRLGSATTQELVAQLENPNAWWRETAHRLIYERQDRSAVDLLRKLLRESDLAQARLHSLWSLEGLASLTTDDLLRALSDPQPQLREHAVLLSESHLANEPALRRRVLELASDENPRVRMQVAFTLGEWSDASLPPSDSERKNHRQDAGATDSDASDSGPVTVQIVTALSEIAWRDAGDHWVRTAILSSSRATAPVLVEALLSNPQFTDRQGGLELIHGLAMLAGGRDDAATESVLNVAARMAERDWRYALVSGLADGLPRRKKRLADLAAGSAGEAIRNLMHQAAITAGSPEASVTERVQAIQLLRHERFSEARPILAPLLSPQQPQEVQLAAVRVLGSFADADVAALLLADWKQLTPPVRTEAIELLAGRMQWAGALLDAVVDGTIPAGQVPPSRRGLLMNSRDPMIKAQAEKLFRLSAPAARQRAIADYQSSLSQSGRAVAGAAVFRRECLNCHRLGGEGYEVGPALTTIKHRSPEEILIHILDPNREVSPNYLDYVVTLKDGRVLTGLIVSETESSLTLRRAQGIQDTILRQDIEDMVSHGKSLMPEGLEEKITKAEMADLIAFLKE